MNLEGLTKDEENESLEPLTIEKETEAETDAWHSINVGSSPIIAHQYTLQKGHRGIL